MKTETKLNRYYCVTKGNEGVRLAPSYKAAVKFFAARCPSKKALVVTIPE